MAYARYRLTMKSEEQEGASQPNIVDVYLSSDADAFTMADNLETAFAADVVSIDKELTTDYALPYPDGTERLWRFVMRDSLGNVQTERLYNVDPAASDSAFAAAIVAAPTYLLVPSGNVIVSVQVADFNGTESI